ncbi:hypothetical protein ACHAW6_003337 [Cyclotella cf. meneghiniana]
MVLVKPPSRNYQYLGPPGSIPRGNKLGRCWLFAILAICVYTLGRSRSYHEGVRGATPGLSTAASNATVAAADVNNIATTGEENVTQDHTVAVDEENLANETVTAPKPASVNVVKQSKAGKIGKVVDNPPSRAPASTPPSSGSKVIAAAGEEKVSHADNVAAKADNAATEIASAPTPASTPPSSGSKICQRDIPIDLSDHTKWPTPYTPSYFDKEPADSEDGVLLVRDGPYGNTLIIGIFHSIDLAYDNKCLVYITKDASWVWNFLTPWFYGVDYIRPDAFWETMEEVLNVTIVDNETVANTLGKKFIRIGSRAGYGVRSQTLNVTTMRNRRDTIFRQLFQHSRTEGDGNVCSNIISHGMDKPGAKYSVIDIPGPNPWNARLHEFTGHNHTEAFEMKPDYVKSILEPLQMLDQPVFLEMTNSDLDPNRDEVKRLIQDPSIKTQEDDVTNDLHMAVLADVYVGNPASHWSLMVARMRYALGFKNTFVLTEKNGNNWVSYIDDTNYLELYDESKIGPWLG